MYDLKVLEAFERGRIRTLEELPYRKTYIEAELVKTHKSVMSSIKNEQILFRNGRRKLT